MGSGDKRRTGKRRVKTRGQGTAGRRRMRGPGRRRGPGKISRPRCRNGVEGGGQSRLWRGRAKRNTETWQRPRRTSQGAASQNIVGPRLDWQGTAFMRGPGAGASALAASWPPWDGLVGLPLDVAAAPSWPAVHPSTAPGEPPSAATAVLLLRDAVEPSHRHIISLARRGAQTERWAGWHWDGIWELSGERARR